MKINPSFNRKNEIKKNHELDSKNLAHLQNKPTPSQFKAKDSQTVLKKSKINIFAISNNNYFVSQKPPRNRIWPIERKENQLLQKRQNFHLTPFYEEPPAKRTSKAFDPDFENNQRKILKYVSNLCKLQQNIIVDCILKVDAPQRPARHSANEIKYSLFKKLENTDPQIKNHFKNEKIKNPHSSERATEKKAKQIFQRPSIRCTRNPKAKKSKNLALRNGIPSEIKKPSDKSPPACKCGILKILVKFLVEIRLKKCRKKKYLDVLTRLIRIAAEQRQNQRPRFSNSLRQFLNLFFCQKSDEESFQKLSALEKIYLVFIILKKDFAGPDLDCLCYWKIKRLEGTRTKIKNQAITEIFVKKMIKQIARNENPELPEQEEQLQVFFEKYFSCRLGEDFSFEGFYWFKHLLLLKKNYLDLAITDIAVNVKSFVRLLHSKDNFKHVFEKDFFADLTKQVFDTYFQKSMQKKMRALIHQFRTSVVGEDYSQRFASFIFEEINNSFFKISLNKKEIFKAGSLVMNPKLI